MKTLSVILRKPPYGDINAAEAVRHALGAVGEDIEVHLFLLDGGVNLARKNQSEGATGFTNLGSTLEDCVSMGVHVYAERASLRDERIGEGSVIDGVKAVDGHEVAVLIRESDRTLIF